MTEISDGKGYTKQETSDGKGITKQVADFGQALIHSALESPINGITQIVNKSTGANIPELEIVGAVKEPSIGAQLGTMAGGVLDYYILTRVAGPILGNLGGTGTAGAALRGGIVGGIYGGILTPSDAQSESFLKDRLANGAVGAAGFAGMAAAGDALARSGRFAVPEMRSLGSTMTFGALSGAAGGIAQSEAEAIFKKGQPLPEIGDLISNTANMAAFGAAFGALNYGFNKISPQVKVSELQSEMKNPRTGEAEKVSLRLFETKNGEVVRLRAEVPSLNSSERIGWEATKMGDGSWSSTAKYVLDGKWTNAYGGIQVPQLTALYKNTDGSVKLDTTDGRSRIFRPDGKYENTSTKPQPEALKVDPTYSEHTLNNKRDLYLSSEPKVDNIKSNAWVSINDGKVQSISGTGANGEKIWMQKSGEGTWKVHLGRTPDGRTAPSEYSWKGEIQAVESAKTGKVEFFDFTPAGSKPARMPRTLDNISEIGKTIQSTSAFEQINPNYRYLRTDAQGNMFIRSNDLSINGTGAAKTEVPVKVLDDVRVKFDIGDRYPVIVDKALGWTKAEGKLLVNGQELKPDTIYDLQKLMGAN